LSYAALINQSGRFYFGMGKGGLAPSPRWPVKTAALLFYTASAVPGSRMFQRPYKMYQDQ